MSLVYFLVSTRGRVLRAVLGIGLILMGWFFLWNHGGVFIALAGLTLVLAAINDTCFLALLYDRPIAGDCLRADCRDLSQQTPLTE